MEQRSTFFKLALPAMFAIMAVSAWAQVSAKERTASIRSEVLHKQTLKSAMAGDVVKPTQILRESVKLNPSNPAALGDLDPTFGIGGKLVNGTFGNRARGVAIQSDGKIVVVSEWSGPFFEDGFVLVRLHPSGSPDTTFGVNGWVFHPPWFSPRSLAIQPDGKIVIAGFLNPYTGVLARYNPDGSIDSGFGIDGHVAAGVGPFAVAIQPNGRVVAAGTGFNSGFAIGRYNPNGSLVDILTTVDTGWAYSVALQPDGKIVTAGEYRNFDEWMYFSIVSFNSDGSLDTNFGGDGKVTTYMNGAAYSVAIQPDGKFVAAGYSCRSCPELSSSGFGVIRYDADGSLDQTFDSDGIVETEISGADAAYSVAIRPDGKLVVAGSCYFCQTNDFAIVRYDPNGSLDNTFGDGNGIRTVDFGGSDDEARGMALDEQGRAVVVGSSNGKFAIARFLLGPTQSAMFELTGQVTSSTGLSVARARVTLTDASGSTRYDLTNPFGYFRFEQIPSGIYTITIRSKRHGSISRPISVDSSGANLDLIL